MATKVELQKTIDDLRTKLSSCQTTSSEKDTTIATLRQKLADCQSKLPTSPPPPPPASPPPPPPPVLGVLAKGIATPGDLQNWSNTDRDRYLDLMKQAGATWIRVGIDMGWPSAGMTLATAARGKGFKVLVTLFDNRKQGTDAITMANFASNVINYGDAFEVWNEPNIPEFWATPDPVKYAGVYNAALGAIKNRKPELKVISGGLSPSPTEGLRIDPATFLTRAMQAGMKPDAIGWHPYCNPNLPGQDASWSTWTKMKSHPTTAQYPVWITEFGHPTNRTGGNSIHGLTFQAQSVTKAFEVVKGYGWKTPLFIYEGRDGGTDPANDQHHYGLLNYNWSRKPAYDALKAVVV